MSSIKEQAQAYEPQQTKNIAELDKVSVDLQLREKTIKEGTPDEFTLNITTVNGEDYKVPNSVLGLLKDLLEDDAELKYFKVKSKGIGLNTRYTVMPVKE